MNRPAPTPPGATRHKPMTVLTVVAVVLAFAVLAGCALLAMPVFMLAQRANAREASGSA